MLKKLVVSSAVILGLIAALVGGFVAYATTRWPPKFPDTPRPRIAASEDPAIIARGEYLFHHVAHCSHCHAPLDDVLAIRSGSKVVPKGGELDLGPLGKIRPSNLTSDAETGVGARSDEDLARAIVYGVRHDDVVAVMMMAAAPMSEEDLIAVISYMRSLPPVKNAVPPHEVSVLAKLLFAGPLAFYAAPKLGFDQLMGELVKEGGVSVERGRYLATGPAACFGCHSKLTFEDGAPRLDGPIFSGGMDAYPDQDKPSMELMAPNLTPHPKAGHIAAWDEEAFVKRFRQGRVHRWSPMPWEAYTGLTEDDVRSLYRYLRALPPSDREVGPVYRERGWRPDQP